MVFQLVIINAGLVSVVEHVRVTVLRDTAVVNDDVLSVSNDSY